MPTTLPALHDLSTLDDMALVARMRQGDASAFEATMRRHNRLLFRSARGILKDDAEAQDVVQDTWLRALSRLDQFRGEAALSTWLARIAIHLALDVRRQRQRTVHTEDLAPDAAMPEPAMPDTDADHNPQTWLARSQLRHLLQQAIDSLPDIYRSVFMLRAVQDMSVDEAATCLQVSDAVIKTRYLRARAMLRDALGAHIEAHALDTYAFAGARCDAVVAHVLARLRQQGHIPPVP